MIGQTPGADPGGVGIGAGGTFVTDQVFAHGGQNRSGGSVMWDAENRPGVAVVPYVRPGTFAVGSDGIPGCMGINSPRNNASDACRKRLARGQETGQQDPGSSQAKWGFCQGGTEGWLPEPPPPCQASTVFFSCQFPYGNDFGASCGPKVLEFNTGKDDPQILLAAVDDGLGRRTDNEDTGVDGPEDPAPAIQVRFPRPVIPNPSAQKPTLHLVGAGTLRDLDLLEGVDNTDVVFKTEVTSCPIDLVNGGPDCFTGDPPDPCADQGGNSDGDLLCDDEDPCKFFTNTLPLVISGFSGIPDECLCGDFDGDGFHSATDAAAVNDCAAFLRFDCVSERDEVAPPIDGFYSATDADLINRVSSFLDPAYTLACGLRPEATCGGDTGVSCF